MTTQQANPTNKTLVLCDNPKTVNDFFKKYINQISAALPKHITPERMLRLTLTSLTQSPKLKKCTVQSLFGAVIQASQLGLEVGNGLGHAYLVPYKTNCQFIAGYRGMVDLIYRSPKVSYVSSHAVYENDEFDYEYGTKEFLRHKPARNRGESITNAYAIVHLQNGAHKFEVMSREEIDKIRDKSASYISWKRGIVEAPPIWETNYEEMAKKTPIRRLFKTSPVSIEIQRLIVQDELGELGLQNNEEFLDIPAETIEPISRTEEVIEEIKK